MGVYGRKAELPEQMISKEYGYKDKNNDKF